jgi:hypothetical protein
MTASASATEEQVITHVDVNTVYGSAFKPAEHYTVPARPGFALRVERDGDTWIIDDPLAGVHGAGQSPSEALRDFQAATLEHVDVLERQETLSDALCAQLKYLRARI